MDAVADSSFVIAVALPKDSDHEHCVRVFKQHEFIYLPQTTLAEVGYLLTRAGGNRAAASFLNQMFRMKYRPICLEQTDFERTAKILEQYADARIDFVDATVIAIAERLQLQRVLTLDRRDFSIVRPTHADYFELLP